VRRRQKASQTRSLIERLDIRPPSPEAPVRTLSGGNQQKVMFAKWLLRPPRVLIADDPTRGVDIGAKVAIYDLIGELAADGVAVLVISSELEEILGLAHRVCVMRRGALVAELDGDEATYEAVTRASLGAGLGVAA
jgi:ABC-type sugar transport system ATPase subunit